MFQISQQLISNTLKGISIFSATYALILSVIMPLKVTLFDPTLTEVSIRLFPQYKSVLFTVSDKEAVKCSLV